MVRLHVYKSATVGTKSLSGYKGQFAAHEVVDYYEEKLINALLLAHRIDRAISCSLTASPVSSFTFLYLILE